MAPKLIILVKAFVALGSVSSLVCHSKLTESASRVIIRQSVDPLSRVEMIWALFRVKSCKVDEGA